MSRNWLEDLIDIAMKAGAVVMRHYGHADARLKPDSSPVTDADEAAEAVILEELGRLSPKIPVIARKWPPGRRG